jgi:proline iminopeptidase
LALGRDTGELKSAIFIRTGCMTDSHATLPPKGLYPAIDPFDVGFMPAGRHQIYYEQSGNPHGIPVVVLHGGPGGGSSPNLRCYFNPAAYRIILFDQRGCGRSMPHASQDPSLEDNTTWHLVADIEALRRRLNIDSWVVFAGLGALRCHSPTPSATPIRCAP